MPAEPPDALAPDFPAAHSMDTGWFAVDAEGRVGMFWSDEEGGVPQGALYGYDAENDLEFSLLHVLRLCRLFEAGIDPNEKYADIEIHGAPSVSPPRQVVVVVDPPEGVDPEDHAAYLPEIDGSIAHVLRPDGPRVLLSRTVLDGHWIDAIEARPAVRWVNSVEGVEILLEEHTGPDGIFHFHYAGGMGNRRPFRYERQGVPEHAITLDELPPPVREKLLALRLDLDYEREKNIRLNAHMPRANIHTWRR